MGAGLPTTIAFLLLATVYLLPSLLAWRRSHPWRQKILYANVLVGWTIVGWIVCMGLALKMPQGKMPAGRT